MYNRKLKDFNKKLMNKYMIKKVAFFRLNSYCKESCANNTVLLWVTLNKILALRFFAGNATERNCNSFGISLVCLYLCTRINIMSAVDEYLFRDT